MAWRPERLAKSGELDNTTLAWTVGWLELDGVDQRMQLKLVGNCHAGLAGWKFRIYRVEPELPQDGASPDDSDTDHRDQQDRQWPAK